jgi:hypothetical protein
MTIDEDALLQPKKFNNVDELRMENALLEEKIEELKEQKQEMEQEGVELVIELERYRLLKKEYKKLKEELSSFV